MSEVRQQWGYNRTRGGAPGSKASTQWVGVLNWRDSERDAKEDAARDLASFERIISEASPGFQEYHQQNFVMHHRIETRTVRIEVLEPTDA